MKIDVGENLWQCTTCGQFSEQDGPCDTCRTEKKRIRTVPRVKRPHVVLSREVENAIVEETCGQLRTQDAIAELFDLPKREVQRVQRMIPQLVHDARLLERKLKQITYWPGERCACGCSRQQHGSEAFENSIGSGRCYRCTKCEGYQNVV